MLDTLKIQDIDRILDELEFAAQSEDSLATVLRTAAERLQFLLDARGTAFFFLPFPECWTAQVIAGEVATDVVTKRLLAMDPESAKQLIHDDWIAVPISQQRWESGALVVQFSTPQSSNFLAEAVKFCHAVAEIVALRRVTEVEQHYESENQRLQLSFERMSSAETRQDAVYSFVNDVAALTAADRVSFVKPPNTIVISGAVNPQRNSSTVVSLEKLGKHVIKQAKPLLNHDRQTAGLRDSEGSQQDTGLSGDDPYLHNLLCLPLKSRVSQSPAAHRPDCCLLLEWEDYVAFVKGSGCLQRVLPGLFTSWRQTDQLLAIPRSVRNLFLTGKRIVSATWGFKIARWVTVIGAALLLAFALAIPTPFRVEIQGTLQPVAQREVYTEMDGVVAKVFVEDDQRVREGDPLVTVRSPDLEIEVQEVIGEMRALAKKRDGLELTINQLQNQDRDLIRERQLSSEIAELETRLDTLREKEAALRAEQEKLTVFAPIDGTIASQDIERHLRTRPVQRGDALLRIVSFSGPWQLELLVPDADSGHVRTALFGNQNSDEDSDASSAGRSIEYVIASNPDRKLVARAEWMADSARNPNGNGVFVDLIASVDSQVAAQSHMGATVYAYVDCGLEPFWYVWSRPLVEFIQRKLWF